jgi:YD repeat-containing protein
MLTVLMAFSRSAGAQEIRYIYDDLNRLIGVVDQQGNAAEYVYDAVGNILQIKRFTVDPNAAVGITLVRPSSGPVGATVQIFGKGFSTTPGDNQVRFSGILATVSTATATSLTATVPAGATTGPITLTTPLGSATSPEAFTVLAFTLVPSQAVVPRGGSVGFQATLGGTTITEVTWRVNGIVGGDATVGTVSAAGLYMAPSAVPAVQPLTIEAVRTQDPSQVATASVQVVDQAAGLTSAAPLTVGVTERFGAEVLAAPLTVGVTPAQGAQALSGALSVTGGPVVRDLAPNSAPPGSTALPVTLTGGNLQGTSTIRFLQNGSVDSTLTASALVPAGDGTSVSFSLSISGSAATGIRVLQVVTPQGTSTDVDIGGNRFTVTP